VRPSRLFHRCGGGRETMEKTVVNNDPQSDPGEEAAIIVEVIVRF
jgi:hypothetical protein